MATKKSGVLAKLKAEKREVQAKQRARGTGGKGPGGNAEPKPDEDPATAERTAKVEEQANRSKARREELHLAGTAARRVSTNAASRGRKAQAKRDSKNG